MTRRQQPGEPLSQDVRILVMDEPSAALTQYPLDETVPTWYVNYMDPDTAQVAFTVIIDARSGDVMQAIDIR